MDHDTDPLVALRAKPELVKKQASNRQLHHNGNKSMVVTARASSCNPVLALTVTLRIMAPNNNNNANYKWEACVCDRTLINQ